MKLHKIVLTTLFSAFVLVAANAQYEDEAIKATLNNYIEGGAVGDTARLNRAFFPFANLRSLSKEGKVSDMPVKKFIAGVPAGGAKWAARIVSYSYAGTSATAVTEEEFDSFKYVDFLNLLKINNEWKIVSRVFSKVDKTVAVSAFPAGGSSTFSSSASPSSKTSTTTAKKPAPKPKASDDGW